MPIPKTMQEAEQRALAAGERAAERWRKQTPDERQGIGVEEVRHDAYVREAILLRTIMDGGTERIAEGLIEHCQRINSNPTLASVVAVVIKAAEERFGNKPETSLREMAAGLVAIFGADKVREAVSK